MKKLKKIIRFSLKWVCLPICIVCAIASLYVAGYDLYLEGEYYGKTPKCLYTRQLTIDNSTANILVDHARHHRTSCDFYKGYLTKIKVDILELIDEFEKIGYTVVSHRNGFGIVEYITVSWNTNSTRRTTKTI